MQTPRDTPGREDTARRGVADPEGGAGNCRAIGTSPAMACPNVGDLCLAGAVRPLLDTNGLATLTIYKVGVIHLINLISDDMSAWEYRAGHEDGDLFSARGLYSS